MWLYILMMIAIKQSTLLVIPIILRFMTKKMDILLNNPKWLTKAEVVNYESAIIHSISRPRISAIPVP